MQYQAIVEVLGYATGNERPVRIRTTDNQEIVGIPTSLDTHPTALEVYLHPEGADDAEIAVSLARILAVEMT